MSGIRATHQPKSNAGLSPQLAEMKVMRFPEEIKKKKVHGILKIIEPW